MVLLITLSNYCYKCHLFRHILPLDESGRNLYEAVKDGKHYYFVNILLLKITL